VAVVRGGVIGYFESFGLQDRERVVPVGDDTIWRLYSMTKPITGVAMMTLYERGLFHLDDAVDRWIPDWKDMTVREPDPAGGSRGVPVDRPPTIRDILTHTSGIGYGFDNNDLVLGERDWLADHDFTSTARAFGEWPLRFQPGAQWRTRTDGCRRRPRRLAAQSRRNGPLGAGGGQNRPEVATARNALEELGGLVGGRQVGVPVEAEERLVGRKPGPADAPLAPKASRAAVSPANTGPEVRMRSGVGELGGPRP
jgi:hypothetical protein